MVSLVVISNLSFVEGRAGSDSSRMVISRPLVLDRPDDPRNGHLGVVLCLS